MRDLAPHTVGQAPPPVADRGTGAVPTPGQMDQLAPGVRRVTANNPGMMTGPGTNTYLIGTGPVAVVDPGPEDPGHLEAILAAAGGPEAVRWIVVTHTHPDHAPGARALAQRSGAEVMGYDARDGFVPQRSVGDGFVLEGPDFSLRAVHTPGHASNHLCWYHEGHRLLCSGDHIMGGSTVVIRPPDGDMAVYLASLEKVVHVDPPVRHIAPGHGRVLVEPDQVVADLVSHRLGRERRVVKALGALGAGTVDDLIPVAYADVSEQLRPVARFSLWAHLAKLAAEGRAIMEPLQGPVDPASLGLEVTWRAPE